MSPVELLFIHPKFPGQFQRLVEHLRGDARFRLTGLGAADWTGPWPDSPDLRFVSYEAPQPPAAEVHPHVRPFEAAVRRGQQAAQALMQLKLEGYEPDVVYVHPGWGDGLYVKQIFPNARVVGLFEFFYDERGADVGFDPLYPLRLDGLLRIPLLNANTLLALEACDLLLAPTEWQRSRFPAHWRERMHCLHEGVDTTLFQPQADASLQLPNGTVLRAGDEVLTYVSRGFEPYRGFHMFMQALPRILRERPRCQVLLVGGDQHHYGPGPVGYASWREQILAGLDTPLPADRVHFTGMLALDQYLAVLRVSRVHVYLTYPFVLSWSMLEAMAAGCVVAASSTPPVTEVIEHGVNGLLFPFFDVDRQVDCVVQALANPDACQPLRAAAVRTIKSRYDFARVVLPGHLRLLQTLLPEKEGP